MTERLHDHLAQLCQNGSPEQAMAAETIARLCETARVLHETIACGTLPEEARAAGSINSHGEEQKPLDLYADDLFHAAAARAPVALIASEERDAPSATGRAGIALAFDPLDGSSNIETNIAVGTIFSILPALPGDTDGARSFAQPGTAQIAAGFFVYGAQLLLILTFGQGTQCFTWDPRLGEFHLGRDCRIPPQAREYSLNAANRDHWSGTMRHYIHGLETGGRGPRGRDFGMRYTGSLVADGYRILQRGGIFLYPADLRPGYGGGRLRQLYEANPIAFCIEQAGGAAIDGSQRLMERQSHDIHARVPLIFGSRDEVGECLRALTPSDTPQTKKGETANAG